MNINIKRNELLYDLNTYSLSIQNVIHDAQYTSHKNKTKQKQNRTRDTWIWWHATDTSCLNVQQGYRDIGICHICRPIPQCGVHVPWWWATLSLCVRRLESWNKQLDVSAALRNVTSRGYITWGLKVVCAILWNKCCYISLPNDPAYCFSNYGSQYSIRNAHWLDASATTIAGNF